MPAAIYIETHGGTGVGGSDDHAGVDIGRTFTETPPAATPEEFLAPHPRRATPTARGEQGSAAKWAHAAMALAVRALGARRRRRRARPARGAADGRARDEPGRRPPGPLARDLGPDDARALLRAWLDAIELDLTAPRAARLDAGRRASATPTSSAARGGATSASCGEAVDDRRGRRRGGAATTARPARVGLFEPASGDPLRAGRRVPRPREGQARRRARASRGASRSSPTASAACTA